MTGMTRVLSRLGSGARTSARTAWNDVAWAWLGSALSIACLAWLERACAQEWNLPLLIGCPGLRRA